ncbi:MAG: hypothetical protein ACLQHF_09175 [Terracidiphilus sp.]
MTGPQKPIDSNIQHCCDRFELKVENSPAVTLNLGDGRSVQLYPEESQLA